MKLLAVPDGELNLGLSLQLKRLALAAGDTEGTHTQFLLSERVQDALTSTFVKCVRDVASSGAGVRRDETE